MSTRRKRSNPLQSDDFTTPGDLEQETAPEVEFQEELTESFPSEETPEELEGGPLPEETEEPQEPLANIVIEELTESLLPEETPELPTNVAIEELTETPEPLVSATEVVAEEPKPPAPFKSRSRPLKPLRQRNIPRFSSFIK
jgi:hypothetical protein